jgi:glycosyltransferase involved in cell wall biosynthesis
MKIAIVHDYLKEYGGAERVVESLLEIWPDAPVYTTVFLPRFAGPHRSRVEKWNVKTSFLQKIPFKEKLISAFRLVGPWVFKTFDLTKFDVVIVSQAGTFVSPNLIKKNTKSVQITYCHTPPRWLYGYSTAGGWESGWKKLFKNLFGKIPMSILRVIDFKAAQFPDLFIANSNEVAGRIKKFYKRESTVIYPPVEMPSILQNSKRDYYLTGGRLARAKRIDLVVKAFTKLSLPLKVFGKEFSGYGKELEKIAGSNIEFLGEVTDEEKFKLMAGAKAFIFPSEQEDFGIIPVEAMAVGTPVIALAQGGPLETIIDGKTGVFFNERTPESLTTAVKKFEKMKFKSEDCINQAKKFSKERFKKEMLEFVNEHAGTTRG